MEKELIDKSSRPALITRCLSPGAENNISAFSCPQQLQARFQGNFSKVSSQRSCPNGFTLDGCSNSSILSFNYTDCGRGNSYSG